MADTKYTDEIRNKYKSSFPDDWISSIRKIKQKKDQEKFLSDWINKSKEFNILLICNLSKIVLSGDFFHVDYDSELSNFKEESILEFVPQNNQFEELIKDQFDILLDEISNAITLVRYHIECAKKHYENKDEEDFFSAISYRSNHPKRDCLLEVLDTICGVCFSEYTFSYNKKFIRGLLISREKLLSYDNAGPKIHSIIEATIIKIELMLYKLSSSPKDPTFRYNYNFKQIDLKPIEEGTGKIKEFKEAFIDFLDDSKWTTQKIESYQADSHGDVVALWKYVLLMRYYSTMVR